MLATLTDWLWSYVLIVLLIAVGVRFSVGSRFAQLRLFGNMFRQLWNSHLSGTDRGISGFQALVVSVAGRVGGGQYSWGRCSDYSRRAGRSFLDVADRLDWHDD